MTRSVCTGSFCLLAVWLSGCTSFFTARAIESFTASLAAGQIADLQAATSADFQRRALRAADALDSLAVLPLPREEGEIKEIQEIGPDERLVSMEFGDPPRTVQYRLKREAAGSDRRTRKWVVDDVILTQNRSGGQPPLTKSVTEQMDLLITVQEFLKYWNNGSREEALTRLHPDLSAALDSLSPVHLAQITEQMLSGVKLETFRPEARIQTSRATVQIPRQGGQLVLELVRLQEPTPRWVIQDAVLHSTRGLPAQSVSHVAGCVRQATEFLEAYEAGDRAALQATASDAFYEQALQSGDLETAPLPVTRLLSTRYELQEQDHRIDVLFDVGEDTYLIAMSRDKPPEAVLPSQTAEKSRCRVDEVTIYERGGAQIKPLSVLFTAQAIVELFAESLAERDLPLLKQLSTRDLNETAWERFDSPELLHRLPLESIPNAPPRIVTTIFQGPVTEITVTQGTRALTYVLHSTGGRPLVDDVKFPINNRSGSLKTVCSVLAPIHSFTSAWERRDLAALTRNSSDGLHRMVWMRAERVPDIAVPFERFLTPTLPKIDVVGRDQLVTIGTPEHGITFRLVPDRGRLVVEDVHVVGGELPGGKLELAAAMRNWVNAEQARPAPRSATVSPRTNLTTPLAIAPQAGPRGFERSPKTPAAPPPTPPSSETAADADAATLPLLQQPIQIPGA